jgi:hypothetical protein
MGMVAMLALDAIIVILNANYAAFEGDLSSQFFGHAVSALPTRRMHLTLQLEN